MSQLPSAWVTEAGEVGAATASEAGAAMDSEAGEVTDSAAGAATAHGAATAVGVVGAPVTANTTAKPDVLTRRSCSLYPKITSSRIGFAH